MLGHHHQWLASGYDLSSSTFLEMASMVVTGWIVVFLCSSVYEEEQLVHAHQGFVLNIHGYMAFNLSLMLFNDGKVHVRRLF